MGLLASPAIKSMNRLADEIGSLYGQCALGMLSEADVADILGSEQRRRELREAVRSVSIEVGDDKAKKMAIKAARKGAAPWVRTTQANMTYCYDEAEAAARSLLEF